MSSELFAGLPAINIPRSRWDNGSCVTGSMNHGLLVPVDFIPILPGDSMNYKFRDVTRMQTPVAPMFGNIKKHLAAFFVPWRLVWTHTEEFFGANKTTAGPQTTTYLLPHARFSQIEAGSLSHYLGKPYKAASDMDANSKNYYVANILKERAYYLIWNEYFRAQQIVNPVIVDKSDAVDTDQVGMKIGTFNGASIQPGSAASSLKKVSKQFDVFTACTISPQYGSAVSLPLGTTAPVMVDLPSSPGSGDLWSLGLYSAGQTKINLGANPGAGRLWENADYTNVKNAQVYVDLSTATAAKVNDVRYAFQLQKYLELSNYAGNYFFGILQVHYGVTSPDSRLQRPEFLGEFTEDILVHQVTSTADTTNSNVKTPIGATGAVSVTASGTVSLFDKAFVEPGFVCIVQWCRQRQVYSQGVMREDFKKSRYEVYSPEFCMLGDQATLTRELYWKAGESDIFGYQEHWAEYRYRPDRVTGMLDPNVPSSIDYWTLANKFTTKPQLNETFISEQPDNLRRCLVVTNGSVPDYFYDIYQDITFTREMPVRTLPGLIDHFGAM